MKLPEIAPHLEFDPEGWWIARGLSDVSYPDKGNALCFAVEDSSFWFGHRNLCILEALKQFPPAGGLLDIGGGNGYVARAIQQSGLDVVLLEPGLDGVRNAVKRGIRQVVRAALEDTGIMQETIPAVGLFDVIEHISNDREFFTNIHRLLIPGGRVYITVPAHRWLWSDEDVLAGHYRRYSVLTMGQVLENAGYAIEFVTHFFEFLLLPILFRRVLPYRLGRSPSRISERTVRSDHKPGHPLAARIVRSLSRRELSRISAGRSSGMGASCLIVARKL